MIKKRINLFRKKFKINKIDGYIVPKNDEFFGEYSSHDRLKSISNFDGSAGFAIILKDKNFLFVDGRYTIQARKQSGKNFRIVEIHKFLPHKIINNLKLGFDPNLFTERQLKIYFKNTSTLVPLSKNLVDQINKKRNIKNKPFFSMNKKIVGESHISKINKIIKKIVSYKADYIFISAPENVAWLLNIRGHDSPNSPIPNSRLLISKKKEIFLFADKYKVSKIAKEKRFKKFKIIDLNNFEKVIKKIRAGKIIIDSLTCSIKNQSIIQSRFEIISKNDPCYLLKSLKNQIELKNMINAHVEDGVALTKFIYWIKKINKKKITEIDAEKKLEKFRKMNKNYLFPSFNTIAGTGSNGAIVHYRATKNSNRIIKKKDIFLCDSGGQYKFGTTDVTRTICFSKQPETIKNNFTKVLKGHIAVATTDINKYSKGKQIDIKARKYLKKDGLDYAHGTGHGVGFFLNVHEGPQSISKYNSIKLEEGMVISNEPGYYKKGFYGIRIENLVFIKKDKKKLNFENLTLAPIEKDLINFDLLSKKEKNYLFDYHLNVYTKISKFLDIKERKWLAGLI
jgi:Xaa-Pro aminopeptidase